MSRSKHPNLRFEGFCMHPPGTSDGISSSSAYRAKMGRHEPKGATMVLRGPGLHDMHSMPRRKKETLGKRWTDNKVYPDCECPRCHDAHYAKKRTWKRASKLARTREREKTARELRAAE